MKKRILAKDKPLSLAVKKIKYDKDFYLWTQTQASLLREGFIDKIDLQNIAEEIESLGNSDKRSLESYLERLLKHLLKKQFQPERDGASWDKSIFNSRKRIARILKDCPSLKNYMKDSYNECYEIARKEASLETKLPEKTFPKKCPWKLEEIL